MKKLLAESTREEKDWQQVIMEIQDLGYTQVEIERATGVKQSTLSKMLSGQVKSPSWVTGNALLKLLP